jgi:hypothetical protein
MEGKLFQLRLSLWSWLASARNRHPLALLALSAIMALVAVSARWLLLADAPTTVLSPLGIVSSASSPADTPVDFTTLTDYTVLAAPPAEAVFARLLAAPTTAAAAGGGATAAVDASAVQRLLVDGDKLPRLRRWSYFVALNLFNSEDILLQTGSQLLRLCAMLGLDNVFVSIFENGASHTAGHSGLIGAGPL